MRPHVFQMVVATATLALTASAHAEPRVGDLFAVEGRQRVIHRIDPVTFEVSVWATNICTAVDIAFAPDGDVFLACVNARRILHIDGATGARRDLAFDPGLQSPSAIALEASGALIVRTLFPSLVRVDPLSDTWTPLTHEPEATRVYALHGVEVAPDGRIFMTALPDTGLFGLPGGVLEVDPATGAETYVATMDRDTALFQIVLADDGALYTVDGVGNRVLRVDPASRTTTVVASGGVLAQPRGIEQLRDGDLVVTQAAMIGQPTASLVRVPLDGRPPSALISGSDLRWIGITVWKSQLGPLFDALAELIDALDTTPLFGDVVGLLPLTTQWRKNALAELVDDAIQAHADGDVAALADALSQISRRVDGQPLSGIDDWVTGAAAAELREALIAIAARRAIEE